MIESINLTKSPLIFTDLDGTLLDHHTYSAEPAFSTLEQLNKLAIPVIVNTSKTAAEIIEINKYLSLTTPFIVENGAAVYLPKALFTKQPNGAESNGDFWIKPFCNQHTIYKAIIKKVVLESGGLFAKAFRYFSDFTINSLIEHTGLSPENAKLALQREYGEPLLWTGSNDLKKRFINKLNENGALVLEGGRFLHVSGNCNKGKALAWLTGQYQDLCPEESFITIALGDSGNDNAMLEIADIAIQVKSPSHPFPTLNRINEKVMSTYKTNEYGPSGWAEVINKLIDFSSLSTHEVISQTYQMEGASHG